MPTRTYADALTALLALARSLTQANMTAAVIHRAPGEVLPLRAEPHIDLMQGHVWRWHLPAAPENTPLSLQPVSPEQWPSLVAAGLPFTPGLIAYLDCSAWGQKVAGGLLFFWDSAQAQDVAPLQETQAASAAPVLLLGPMVASLLDGRERAAQTVESEAQFHDIFNSVPHGIVVVSAKGLHAQVNQTAAALLEVPTGLVALDVLAQAMRTVRGRCDNAFELEKAYEPLLHDLDAEVIAKWHLADEVWHVDTHPILRDGHNGRVWLFQDVSASSRLERMLRDEAARDVLTGLFNRRAFYDRAQTHYEAPAAPANASTGAGQLALVLFDIDHFKQINDRFGHPVGDQVLREVARRAKSQLRDGDLLARYGGEEFVLLFGPATLTDAKATAERLRLAISAEPVQADGYLVEARISLGLTLRRDAHELLAQTIKRADALLYLAKRAGRDRVAADGDELVG